MATNWLQTVASAVVVFAASAGCEDVNIGGNLWSCRTDRDCRNGLVCRIGVCRPPGWQPDVPDDGLGPDVELVVVRPETLETTDHLPDLPPSDEIWQPESVAEIAEPVDTSHDLQSDLEDGGTDGPARDIPQAEDRGEMDLQPTELSPDISGCAQQPKPDGCPCGDSSQCASGACGHPRSGQVCLPTCIPTGPETCDGRDNDCDGLTDEDLGTTTCGTGDCTATVARCNDGVPQTCTPGAAGSEVCDGRDNDCDDLTDEDLGTTTCGTGDCTVTVANCNGGVPQTCTPGAAGSEVCDGRDNDCDGGTDGEEESLCNDGDPCTNDSCGGTGGCANIVMADDESCDDGTDLTFDSLCLSAVCLPRWECVDSNQNPVGLDCGPNPVTWDRKTGLFWQFPCQDIRTFPDAGDMCANAGIHGWTGWRLPTNDEMNGTDGILTVQTRPTECGDYSYNGTELNLDPAMWRPNVGWFWSASMDCCSTGWQTDDFGGLWGAECHPNVCETWFGTPWMAYTVCVHDPL